jgi:hypothetical protein
MEMDVVAGQHERDRGEEIIAKRTSKRKIYWKQMDHIVGASNGRETSYIYVEYGSMGNVHGRPITKEELRKKGAKP